MTLVDKPCPNGAVRIMNMGGRRDKGKESGPCRTGGLSTEGGECWERSPILSGRSGGECGPPQVAAPLPCKPRLSKTSMLIGINIKY